MSVSTLEHHSLAVDEDLSASVLNLSEAVLLRVNITSDRNIDGIKIGSLGRPKFRILYLEVKTSVLLSILYVRNLQDSGLDGLACRVHKFYIYAGISLFAEVLKGNFDAEESTTEVVASASTASSAHHCCHLHILNMQFLTRFEIDVTMNSTHSEHILILNIRAVAPTINLNTNEVFLTWFDVFCYVEFCIHIGSLSISDLLSVHPNIGGTINTIKVEINLSAVPIGGNLDGTAITAYCIGFVDYRITLLTADERWQILERIGHISIDGSAVTLHFHARRNRNGLPRRSVEVRLIKVDWTVFGFRNPIELPLSVQHQPERRVRPKPRFCVSLVGFHLFLAGIEQHSGSSGFFVNAENCFVFPVVL